jgi:hypothetical protein
MNTYKVLSIDAWADGDDSWTWNAWYNLGTVEVDLDSPKDVIIDALIDAGMIDPRTRALANTMHMEDDQYNLVLCDGQTFEPLLAIEYGSAN